MKVYIPTLNREGKQITLASIPERWKQNTYLVCPDSENHDWDNRISVPDDCIGHIGKTRQWIIEQSDDPHVAQLDDDLTFYQRDDEKLTKNYRLDDCGKLLYLMSSWLEEGDVYCGLSNSFMSHERDDEYYYGKPSHSLFVNRDYLEQKGIRYDDMVYFEDFHVPLSVLESGKRLRYTGRYIATERLANAPGGCSTQRTMERNRAAMIALRDKHPRYVLLKEEQGAKNQNLEVGLKMTIRFKKAYDDNVVRGATLDEFFDQ